MCEGAYGANKNWDQPLITAEPDVLVRRHMCHLNWGELSGKRSSVHRRDQQHSGEYGNVEL